jgi:hypothetical protein
MRFYGGGPVGIGNAGVFNNSVIGANTNPLIDPRFKIQGGEPWNPTPLLPGADTKRYEQQQQFNIPRQLPSAGISNLEGLLAQAPPPAQEDLSGFQQMLDQMTAAEGNKMRGQQMWQYPLSSY